MAQKFLTDIDVSGKLIIDGSNFTSGSLLLEVQGTQGQLFSVTDSLTGDLFSVSDISGIPIINVNSNGNVDIDGTLNLEGTLSLPDQKKILLGDSNDLEIYHDGSNSYISDVGTGDLYLKSNKIRLQSTTGENLMFATENSGVFFYFNNDKKFETTSAGVTVTGQIKVPDGSASTPSYSFSDRADTGMYAAAHSSNDRIHFATDGSQRFYIDSNGSTSVGNSYVGENNSFRNYAGDWGGTTGTANKGFYFLNTANSNTTKAMEVTHDGDATFAGKITAAGDPGVLVTGSGNSTIHVASTGTGLAGMYMDASNGDFIGSDYVFIGQDNDKTFRLESFNSSGDILLRESNTNTLRLSGGNATFAGSVTGVAGAFTGILTVGTTTGSNINMLRTSANYINATNETGYLVFRTGGFDTALTLDASQNATFAGDLTLDDNSGASPSLYFKNGNNNFWRLFCGSSEDLTFRLGTVTKFEIDSSGNATFSGSVGINTPSSYTANGSAANLVIGSGSGSQGMTIYSGTASNGSIYFADDLDEEEAGDNPVGSRDGLIVYSHANSRFDFKTGGNQQALRLQNNSATFSGTIAATNFSGSSSGTNTGDQDLSGYATTSHNHDDIYYTENELDAGQLDNRYYTESEINASWYNAATTRAKFTTTDGTGDNYTFEIEDESNFSGNKWYHIATINNHNGGLHIRGAILNHVENYASQKLDIAIQVREAGSGSNVEITGSVNVLHNDSSTNGTDKAGVRVIQTEGGQTYNGYKVYVRTTRYSMLTLRLTQQGTVTFNTVHTSPATSEPAPITNGSMELDTSTLAEGNYVIDNSTPREIYHEGHTPTASEVDAVSASAGGTFSGSVTIQSDDDNRFLVRSNDYTISRIISRGNTGTNLDKGLFSLMSSDGTNNNIEAVRIDSAGNSWFNGGAVSFGDNVTVTGNLTVNGTTTTINTSTVEVEDNILQLNTTQGTPDTMTATTSGISVYRGDGVTQASLIFDDGDDTWDLTNNLQVAGNTSVLGTFGVSDLPANLTSTSVLVRNQTIGAELITNGDFATGSGYSGSHSIASGKLTKTTGGLAYQTISSISSGATYLIKVDVDSISGATQIYLGGNNSDALTAGVQEFYMVAGSSNTYVGFNNGYTNNTGSVFNNFSIKLVTRPNNQIQTKELGSNAFNSTSFLPLSGGTLSGALNGTSAVFTGNLEVQGSEIELGGNWIIKGTDGTYFQRIKTVDSSATDPVDTFSFDVKLGSSASWKSLLVLDQHDDARFSGTASFVGNVTAPSFTGRLQGALTGAPDATIWCVSGDYTDWGIFYDEGNPDKILFKSSGNTKASIALDTGDIDGGAATFTSATINGNATVTGNTILGNAFTDKTVIQGHLGIGDDTYPKIAYPGQNALWGEANNSTVGQVVIDIPGTLGNYDMMYMEIDMYEYNSTNATKLIIGAHNWNSGGNSGTGNLMWYNAGVKVLGSSTKSVYLGWRNDGTNNRRVIAIGETNSTWNYPTIHVAKVHGNDGYDTGIDWIGDWSINLTTSNTYFTKSPTTNFNTVTSTTFTTRGKLLSSGATFTGALNGVNATFTSQVGVGVASSSNAMLDVKGPDTDNAVLGRFWSNTGARGSFIIRNGSGVSPTTFIGTAGGSEQLSIGTDNDEAIRIDASQNTTFKQNVDVDKTLSVGGGDSRFIFHSGASTVTGSGTSNATEIDWKDSTHIIPSLAYAFRVKLVVQGTGTDTGASYIVYYNNTTSAWVVRHITLAGTTSNHAQLTMVSDGSGTYMAAYHTHSGGYSIRYWVETFDSGDQDMDGHAFGSDFQWQRNNDTLKYTDGDVEIGGFDDGSNYNLTLGWNAVSNQAVGTKRSALTFKTSQTAVNNNDIYKWDIAMVTAPATASSEPFGSDLAFLRSTRNSTSVDQTTMILTQQGNVGIGNSLNINKLDVSGNINIQGGNGGYLTFNNGDANIVVSNNGTGRDLVFKTYNPDNGNNTERMRLDKNGVLSLQGNLKIKNALIDNASVTSATTTTTVASVSGTTYAAVFFDYVIYKSSNIRAGTVVACCDGTNVSFTETSTTDLGDTSDVTLAVDYSSSNFRLRATTTSSTWNIKAIIRAI